MPSNKKPEFTLDDLAYAYETAANLMEQEEFSGDNAQRQKLAYMEVAKRLARTAARYRNQQRRQG